MPNQETSSKAKLQALRERMSAQGVDGFIIPRADEFQGEFVAPYAERLKWLTGFTGSGGAAIVLADKAIALTDARYTLQIKTQVDGDIWDTGDSAENAPGAWIAENLEEGVIGYDPKLHTPGQLETLKKALADKSITLQPVENLVDAVWDEQPEPPRGAVEVFPQAIAGASSEEKRKALAESLKAEGLEAFVITLPDSIAWLLNVRGSDINHIPLVLSYALLKNDGALLWFIDPHKVGDDVRAALGAGVEIVPMDDMAQRFEALSGAKVGLDFKRSPVWFKSALAEAGADVEDFKDPSIDPKALKTQAEQDAIKATHVRDGAALAEFLYWVDREAGGGALSELDVVDMVEECRARIKGYRGASFPTIAGCGENGAVIHYRPSEKTNRKIMSPSFLLVDSGGQYLCEDYAGTTDITRTIAIGEISDEMKRSFTLVLKGHIAVASAVFKEGAIGKEIDALARAALQEEGLNFAHGTGHGVGCYLAVHEEAANLSPKGEGVLKAGMLLSNEPGYYKEGAYGIRTENLVLVKEAEQAGHLEFETVSFAPIDLRAVDVSMLSDEERAWLNAYHEQVYAHLAEHLSEEAREWLRAQTRAL